MKKGIVMEVKSDTIIMMTPEGEFHKARKQPAVQYEIGEELTFLPKLKGESHLSFFDHWKQRLHFKPILAGAAALLMLLFILIPAVNDPGVYAYVSVDINPSFEMSIDKDREVLQMKAFNPEAKHILESLSDWKGKSIVEVAEEIISISEKNGYLDEHKKVTLTTVFTEEADEEIKNSIEDEIKEFASEKMKEGTADISSIESSLETRKEAAAAGLTTGQLLMKEENAQKEKATRQKASEETSQPSKPEITKEKNEQPKKLPETKGKRPDHVEEKQAGKSKANSNSRAHQNQSDHGADKKEEKGNNGKSNRNEKGEKPNTPENNNGSKGKNDLDTNRGNQGKKDHKDKGTDDRDSKKKPNENHKGNPSDSDKRKGNGH
ncbi:hypothetical protein D3H55_17150 [Bacillus salacetis]|uniref:RsgI N-terminal anti-sigma domain-containing protein n=1 Tax=Bacillus salacetis TaxID=2315464 RepID=A0A3A1QSA3_9BACI|nr:anti-sigma factor domain-containing protein [Bacillus salacetis]RIW30172.1 hypothetical protein D3H55_17150 [Bacillus salacetis]